MHCPDCGCEINLKTDICPDCGAKFEDMSDVDKKIVFNRPLSMPKRKLNTNIDSGNVMVMLLKKVDLLKVENYEKVHLIRGVAQE